MNENYIVKKSNYFIMNSSYDLSLEEQKIILTLASMVQPNDEEFKPYKFKVADFMELLGIETQTKYTEVPKITKELMKKVFEIEEEKRIIQTAWLSGAIYEKGTGYVELTFSPYLKPYMLQLNKLFTQYKLANILSMKSKYSIRIYEILKANEFKEQGYFDIGIEELRKLVRADNVYPKYNDFKKYVLLKAQQELIKLSDIKFEFEEKKTGRKVTTIRFYISKNTPKKPKPIESLLDKKTKKPKLVEDETSVTAEGNSTNNRSKDIDYVLALFEKEGLKLEPLEALKILKSSEYNLDIITQAFEQARTQDIINVVAWMIAMVKPGILKPKKGYRRKLKFDNFTPREYDFDDLEKKLLGWDK